MVKLFRIKRSTISTKRKIAREKAPRPDINLNNKCVLCLSHLGKDYCIALDYGISSYSYHYHCFREYITSLVSSDKRHFTIPETNEEIKDYTLDDIYKHIDPVGYYNDKTDEKPIWKRFGADGTNSNLDLELDSNSLQTQLSELGQSSEAIIIENDDERRQEQKKQTKLVDERKQQLKNIQLVSQLIFRNGIKIAPNEFSTNQSSNDRIASEIVAPTMPSPLDSNRISNRACPMSCFICLFCIGFCMWFLVLACLIALMSDNNTEYEYFVTSVDLIDNICGIDDFNQDIKDDVKFYVSKSVVPYFFWIIIVGFFTHVFFPMRTIVGIIFQDQMRDIFTLCGITMSWKLVYTVLRCIISLSMLLIPIVIGLNTYSYYLFGNKHVITKDQAISMIICVSIWCIFWGLSINAFFGNNKIQTAIRVPCMGRYSIFVYYVVCIIPAVVVGIIPFMVGFGNNMYIDNSYSYNNHDVVGILTDFGGSTCDKVNFGSDELMMDISMTELDVYNTSSSDSYNGDNRYNETDLCNLYILNNNSVNTIANNDNWMTYNYSDDNYTQTQTLYIANYIDCDGDLRCTVEYRQYNCTRMMYIDEDDSLRDTFLTKDNFTFTLESQTCLANISYSYIVNTHVNTMDMNTSSSINVIHRFRICLDEVNIDLEIYSIFEQIWIACFGVIVIAIVLSLLLYGLCFSKLEQLYCRWLG